MNGSSLSIVQGAKVESSNSDIAVSARVTLLVPDCPKAAPASDSTATITNFDTISATSSSTSRTAQSRRAGQTSAANTIGSINTMT